MPCVRAAHPRATEQQSCAQASCRPWRPPCCCPRRRRANERTAVSVPATALTGATLIDGSGAAPSPNTTIVIENGRIRDIGPAAAVVAAAGRRRRRPRRQVRGAGHHQCPRPCRAAAARPAAAPIRALRRDHHDQHVFRPGRRRRVQGQTEGRRPARRPPADGEIPLHVAAVQPGLGGEDAGGRPRQGRRDRRQGRRLREGVDRRPGRPPSQALARVLRRRARAGAQARLAHHGARGRARRRPHDRRRRRQHPRPQRARPGDPGRLHRHAQVARRLGDLDARARRGAVRVRRRARPSPTIRSSRRG